MHPALRTVFGTSPRHRQGKGSDQRNRFCIHDSSAFHLIPYPSYAMTFLGFITGARPSTLRPLRRSGSESDILWDEGLLLLRRSNALGEEIMDQTKTAVDQELPLPPEAIQVLRDHLASLPDGPMHDSEYLFPSAVAQGRQCIVELRHEAIDAVRSLPHPYSARRRAPGV
jgi:hypothetical protein